MMKLSYSDNCLRLTNTPSYCASALCVGIISLGLGASYYGSGATIGVLDNTFLKLGYILGCVVIGLSLLEDWESCIIDKNSRTVTLSRANVYQMVLRLRRSRDLRMAMDNVIAVQAERLKSAAGQSSASGRWRLSLMLISGISLPLLDGDGASLSQIESDLLSERLRTFLELNHLESVDSVDLEESRYYSNHDDGSSSDDGEIKPLANDGRPRDVITLIGDNG